MELSPLCADYPTATKEEHAGSFFLEADFLWKMGQMTSERPLAV